MKVCYAALMVLGLAISLSACKNRFEEYEPYSAFDERMAMAERPQMSPDDQMPPGMVSPYANNDVDAYYSEREPVTMSQNRSRARSSDDMEVPFDAVRGEGKPHPANIGAM